MVIQISNNNMIWIVWLIAFVVITAIALVFFFKNKRKRDFKKSVLKSTTDVDFSAVTHDWEKAKTLYDELKKKCHPDKYGDELNGEATRIFQLIIENKYKYPELLKLRDEAIEKLGIVI